MGFILCRQACALAGWPLVFISDMIDFTARQLSIMSVTKINPTTKLALFWRRVSILGFFFLSMVNMRSNPFDQVTYGKNYGLWKECTAQNCKFSKVRVKSYQASVLHCCLVYAAKFASGTWQMKSFLSPKKIIKKSTNLTGLSRITVLGFSRIRAVKNTCRHAPLSIQMWYFMLYIVYQCLVFHVIVNYLV